MRGGVTRALMEVFLGSGTPDKFKIRSRARQKGGRGRARYSARISNVTPYSARLTRLFRGWDERGRQRGGERARQRGSERGRQRGSERGRGGGCAHGRIKNVTRRSHVPRIHDSYLFIYPV